jgi:hypothetical protein
MKFIEGKFESLELRFIAWASNLFVAKGHTHVLLRWFCGTHVEP